MGTHTTSDGLLGNVPRQQGTFSMSTASDFVGPRCATRGDAQARSTTPPSDCWAAGSATVMLPKSLADKLYII